VVPKVPEEYNAFILLLLPRRWEQYVPLIYWWIPKRIVKIFSEKE
jgi:hypothetical protein